jgi:hypothetical protein
MRWPCGRTATRCLQEIGSNTKPRSGEPAKEGQRPTRPDWMVSLVRGLYVPYSEKEGISCPLPGNGQTDKSEG